MGKHWKLLLGVIIVIAAIFLWWSKPFFFLKETASPDKTVLTSESSVTEDISTIVKTYRQIIILFEDESSLNPQQREAASIIGRMLFYENQKRLETLMEQLAKDIDNEAAAGFTKSPQKVEGFLRPLETLVAWHDADKLVFREVVDHLAESLRAIPGSQKAKVELQERLDSDKKALMEIQSLYDKELEKIFGRFDTRGIIVHREAWEQYVAYLKTKFKRDDILKEHAHLIPEAKAKPEKKTVERIPEIITGSHLPPKSLVLTFDDGPHPRYTDRIMEILKKYDAPAIFFQVGQNLGSIKKDKTVKLNRSAAVSQRLLNAGFVLANHTHTHPYLPKLDDKNLSDEIDHPNQLIHQITNNSITLFRPPYGAQNGKVLTELKKRNIKSVLWNIDSKDWADPVPKSIANRVIREVSQYNHGIILFHDIHERTIEALPLILETLKNDGYQFLAWEGKDFTSSRGKKSSLSPPKVTTLSLYRESWAVIIGIDNYRNWPKLNYAVSDAKAVREILIRKYKFKPENIITLLNEEATRDKILSALGDTMGNTEKVKRDDRVFVFFAGHGTTRKLPSGRDLGYIVPVNADKQNYQGQSISMTNFQDISETIPAKHILFVMDSCYSGLALIRGSGIFGTDNYLKEISRRTSRQILTAGGANELVADNGPNGHSIFTWTLLQGLEGRADLNGDGFITAAELAAFVSPGVSALSKQTPAFGNMPGSEGGEFIFESKQDYEFLGELSTQLDEEAIQLNNQLETIRKQITEKKLRNQKLKKKLASIQAVVGKLDLSPIDSNQLNFKTRFMKHMERGDALFKEKKYTQALEEFLSATKLDLSNALAANNVGYTYYKMERYDEAAQWFEKTVALDPRRSIAYANLGDTYTKLNKKTQAKKVYLQYLELSPNSKYSKEVKNKLNSLD